MTLKEIIAIADSAYPDGKVLEAFESLSGSGTLGGTIQDVGDGLAVFIALELSETYDADANTGQQMTEAVRVMRTARNQMDAVGDTLDKAAPWNK